MKMYVNLTVDTEGKVAINRTTIRSLFQMRRALLDKEKVCYQGQDVTKDDLIAVWATLQRLADGVPQGIKGMKRLFHAERRLTT